MASEPVCLKRARSGTAVHLWLAYPYCAEVKFGFVVSDRPHIHVVSLTPSLLSLGALLVMHSFQAG